MVDALLHLDEFAPGQPFHAALVPVRRFDAHYRAPLHTHADFYEIMHVFEGHGTHRTHAGDLPVRAGDLIFIRPGDRHEFTAVDRSGMQFINVAFRTPLWHTYIDLTGLQLASASWERLSVPLYVDAHREAGVAAEFTQALRAYEHGAAALDLVRFWTNIAPLLQQAATADEDGLDTPAWLTHAHDSFIDECDLQAGLQALLDRAGVSRGHLARTMHAHYGCTPIEFVTDRRLSHAAVLLRTTNDPVDTIAHRCGFDGASYFGRVFRSHYGVSPRTYRAAARQAVVPSLARRSTDPTQS